MNAIIENLLTRRSTRAFLQKEIPDNELNEILQAAIYAPSGMGKQTWKFTVLCNQEKIQQLAELIGRKLGRKGYDMYRPQVLIIPSNQKENPHGIRQCMCPGKHLSGCTFLRNRFCLDQSAPHTL